MSFISKEVQSEFIETSVEKNGKVFHTICKDEEVNYYIFMRDKDTVTIMSESVDESDRATPQKIFLADRKFIDLFLTAIKSYEGAK